MGSEDKLLYVLAAVIIHRKITTNKKKKHKVWVQEICRERQKYGVSYLANQMRIYIRKQYFVCVIYFVSLLLTLSLIFFFYFGSFYGTDKCSGFPSSVQKWEICYQIQFFTVWMIRYENYRLNCESFPLTCLKNT